MLNRLIAYEMGELDEQETVDLFAELVRSGTINQLQGSYQRAAAWMLRAGLISPDGEILTDEEVCNN